MSFIISAGGILIAFGSVIFFHEFGHFIVAKKAGIKVEQFSFGFGPEIFGFNWGETRYTVNWIPLGGYVRMAGEVPEEYEGPVLEGGEKSQDRDKSRDFMAQSWKTRIRVALAGPVMNYILAVILFFAVFMAWGKPFQTNKTEIGDVFVGMPAEEAGLKMGDRILAIEGRPVEDFLSIADIISKRAGQKTQLVIQTKAGSEKEIFVTPHLDDQRNRGMIGITPAHPEIEWQKIGIGPSLIQSIEQCWFISAVTLGHLAEKISAREKPDVAGPIGIGQVIIKAVKSGPQDFIRLIAFISVAIGLFNLFPVPLLDGGHVVYYIIEGIRKKPLSPKIMAKANMVGLGLLLMLLVFATMNDINRVRSQKSRPAVSQDK